MELIALEGLPREARFPLGPEPLTLGRSPACDVVIEDEGVSSEHCRVRPAGGGYLIEDLGSLNGTIVNDRQIAQPTSLHAGDLIGVGRALLELRGSAPDGSNRPRDLGAVGGSAAAVASAAQAAATAGQLVRQRLALVLDRLAALESSADASPRASS